MFPDLFSIGPFTVHSYGLLVALACVVGLVITVKMGRSMGFTDQQVMDMGLIMILSGLIGSRLFYVLMNPSRYVQHPVDMLKIWQGGLVFSGGIVGILLTMIWYVRRHSLSIWQFGDLWAPAAATGQGIGRLGCFMAGCCYGKPTHLSWAVTFTDPHSLAPLHVPLHPTQLYSAISGFILFFVLVGIHRVRKFDGQVLLWYLILHSTSRLFLERFRGDDRGVFLNTQMTVTQVAATLILLAAVVALIVRKTRWERDLQDSVKK